MYLKESDIIDIIEKHSKFTGILSYPELACFESISDYKIPNLIKQRLKNRNCWNLKIIHKETGILLSLYQSRLQNFLEIEIQYYIYNSGIMIDLDLIKLCLRFKEYLKMLKEFEYYDKDHILIIQSYHDFTKCLNILDEIFKDTIIKEDD